MALAPVAGIIFDMDGVLVDSSRSFPKAVAQATRIFLRLQGLPEERAPSPEETRSFKLAGGFNDEWDVAWLSCLFALASSAKSACGTHLSLDAFVARLRALGGGREGALRLLQELLPEEADAILRRLQGGLPERLALEVYGGSASLELYGVEPIYVQGPGLWQVERAHVTAAELAPWRGRIGIYTGRIESEAIFALRRFGLLELFPEWARVSASSGIVKPNPEGLRRLAGTLGLRSFLFVGDTVDDALTVQAYREKCRSAAEAGFVGIAPPGSALQDALTELGALLVVPDVATLLRLLPPPEGDGGSP